ncbi:hypothetical protein NC661_16185 [Aquibacillus koreensis]|uniref:Uncharacterized protein n=1 Tax=Aquibacillus koreensis TaxID=279446 RepID=A0A9X4AKY3_9BACI|nr:hypothetical protein [Aquibacillus koreensis]MCT2534491.1 hypothetical protein [Aquibacillus koreensis]MDC3421915.1 hypothetical protein [Aquibacillus koreensis]
MSKVYQGTASKQIIVASDIFIWMDHEEKDKEYLLFLTKDKDEVFVPVHFSWGKVPIKDGKVEHFYPDDDRAYYESYMEEQSTTSDYRVYYSNRDLIIYLVICLLVIISYYVVFNFSDLLNRFGAVCQKVINSGKSAMNKLIKPWIQLSLPNKLIITIVTILILSISIFISVLPEPKKYGDCDQYFWSKGKIESCRSQFMGGNHQMFDYENTYQMKLDGGRFEAPNMRE